MKKLTILAIATLTGCQTTSQQEAKGISNVLGVSPQLVIEVCTGSVYSRSEPRCSYDKLEKSVKLHTQSLGYGRLSFRKMNGVSPMVTAELSAYDWCFAETVDVYLDEEKFTTITDRNSDRTVLDGGKIQEELWMPMSNVFIQQIASSKEVTLRFRCDDGYLDRTTDASEAATNFLNATESWGCDNE
ncbi:hypothetical protein [Vibrio breoganii]|uniref:hypothetical protein n=1 Tax=Vibrio breoganii TaxID=553239 RepID=UPI000C822AB7|nr:hypothetical protein [Vibrio breoganii]PMG08565.1 hypothetical protein BCV00_18635 [Vibrio breoganii]PMG98995.1 hypothetical protein BCU79_18790 [Vibrio breoganii]